MNIKELNQLIEANTDLTSDQNDELYDLFLQENQEVFKFAHTVEQDSDDESDGVDILVDTYMRWINMQESDDVLQDFFIGRTMQSITENIFGALS